MSEEETVKLMTISITRVLNPDGQLGVKFTHTPDTISFVESLGLLSAAQWHLYKEMTVTLGE